MKPVVRLLTTVGAAIALVLGGAAVAVAAPADVNDFEFDSFAGEYFLDLDDSGHATTRVIETIVAVFPQSDQNRGIIRAIPLTYGEVPLEVTMLSVTDENGAPVFYERGDYGDFAEFALGTDEFVHGPTTYVLEYTMRNTIRHFEDSGGDEFYWDINGDGWAQPFGSVSATVHVSDALAESLTGASACYADVIDDCELTRDGNTFQVTVENVGRYDTLTLAIGFEGGSVVPGQVPRDSWIVTIAPLVLLGLNGLLVVIALIVRIVVWRDHRGRGTIIAQYEPPEGTNLLLDANLISRKQAGLPAQFVDFAVRGMVKVIDTDPTATTASETRLRYSLQLVDPAGADREELRVLVALFGISLTPGKEVKPGALPAAVGDALYRLTDSTQVEAKTEGYRAQPDGRLPRNLIRLAFWSLPLFVPIGIWAAVHNVLEGNVIGPAFGSFGLAIVVSAILYRPTLLTEKGAAVRDHLLGIREYLTIAEEDRMRVLQSPDGAQRVRTDDRTAIVKLNERLLSYAVLWGVEDQWADKLRADLGGQAPSWYSGSSFDASALRAFTTSSTSSVRPIVTSSSSGGSWSSSGGSSFSSGSSGGGFSGGGGGGGGGGGR